MTFLYLSSDQMGTGEPELGRTLLTLFLEKLAQSDVTVDLIGCTNSGIYLTTEGSPVIETMKKLQKKGTQIATCGTCLNHLHRRDKLLIGQVGNMEMMVQVMATADRIIRP
jgi:selenium metabolism protein YedF